MVRIHPERGAGCGWAVDRRVACRTGVENRLAGSAVTNRESVQLGLTYLEMYKFMSTFSDANQLQFLEGGTLPTLIAEEPDVRRSSVDQA